MPTGRLASLNWWLTSALMTATPAAQARAGRGRRWTGQADCSGARAAWRFLSGSRSLRSGRVSCGACGEGRNEISGRQTGWVATGAHAVFAALGRRGVPQRASRVAEIAAAGRGDANIPGVPVRWRPPRANGTVALDGSTRHLAEEAAHGTADDLARAFHGADRDRRPARADGPGLGPARL